MGKYLPVLDVCCGPRGFWYNKRDPRALYNDIRGKETHIVVDRSKKSGTRTITIDPDTQHSFAELPFDDDTFYHVVFDPPHLQKAGDSSWLVKRYGKLSEGWDNEIRSGFSECFRVLKPFGTLIFKWNETDVVLSELLKLTDQVPLYGHISGKHSKTHWVAFIKEASHG